MAAFSNNAITDNGRILLSHVQMGAVFTPTRIVMGSGNLPAGTTVRNITAVVTPEQTLTISKKKRGNDGTVTIGGVYSNQSVSTGFYFRELGLYAKAVYPGGQEIAEVLYSYGNAGSTADYMPAYTSGQPVEREIDLMTYIGNDTTVDLTIASEVYVTHKQLDEAIKDVGRGVSSFAGRVGFVLPQSGDYTAEMVGAIDKSAVGAPGGVATLGSDGKLMDGQLPAFILVGPAEMVEQLPPGGLLLITDDGDIADYTLTLQDLLLEGDKAHAGESDALETMLTVGRVRNLNLRKDESGGYYAEEDLSALAQAIREMCAAAQEGGVYVADGATALSWWQVQYYILYNALVSHQEAMAKNWMWARTAQSALAALEARVSNLEGTLGDVNETLDEVNRGLST